MMRKTLIKTIFIGTLSAIFGFFITAGIASAQAAPSFVPLANYAGLPQFSGFTQGGGDFSTYLNSLYTAFIAIGGILAVLRIVYGGWLYGGSSDQWGNKQKAKEVIGDAVIGLILLLSIYLILNQINPCLLNLNFLQDISLLGSSSLNTVCSAT